MPHSTLHLLPLLSAWDTWAFTAFLVIGLPGFAYGALYRGARGSGYFGRLSQVGTHLWISGSLWLALSGLLLVAVRHGLPLAELGLHGHDLLRQIVVTVAGLGLLCAMTWASLHKHRRMPPEVLAQKLGAVSHFMPNSRASMVSFVVMAVSAGVCEELLYRGWLLALVDAATGSVWIGLVLSSLAFGVAHAHQGPQGMVGTGLVGLVLGLLYLWLGGLVPVQILHAFVNLSSAYLCVRLLSGLHKPA